MWFIYNFLETLSELLCLNSPKTENRFPWNSTINFDNNFIYSYVYRKPTFPTNAFSRRYSWILENDLYYQKLQHQQYNLARWELQPKLRYYTTIRYNIDGSGEEFYSYLNLCMLHIQIYKPTVYLISRYESQFIIVVNCL